MLIHFALSSALSFIHLNVWHWKRYGCAASETNVGHGLTALWMALSWIGIWVCIRFLGD
jgi:hypothetical protein